MQETEEFDQPIFKTLAKNDTGQAAGHQGGVLIPQDLDAYFPDLRPQLLQGAVTPDRSITAIAVVNGTYVTKISTRYQFQTWGGDRSPERRITGNLGPLLGPAKARDLLIIERNLQDRDLYRLSLVAAGTAEYARLKAIIGTKKWGPLIAGLPPVTEKQLDDAEADEKDRESKPFVLFDPDAKTLETHATKVARSRAFQKRVIALYSGKCAVCGQGMKTAKGLVEVQAAHIVPRGMKGSDDARNGIAFCQGHHWAFDRGLFGVSKAGVITVPDHVSAVAENAGLKVLAGKAITKPLDPKLEPHPSAFDWHLKNIVK